MWEKSRVCIRGYGQKLRKKYYNYGTAVANQNLENEFLKLFHLFTKKFMTLTSFIQITFFNQKFTLQVINVATCQFYNRN